MKTFKSKCLLQEFIMDWQQAAVYKLGSRSGAAWPLNVKLNELSRSYVCSSPVRARSLSDHFFLFFFFFSASRLDGNTTTGVERGTRNYAGGELKYSQ